MGVLSNLLHPGLEERVGNPLRPHRLLQAILRLLLDPRHQVATPLCRHRQPDLSRFPLQETPRRRKAAILSAYAAMLSWARWL